MKFDGVPARGTPLPKGVANLRYTIALAACEPFLVDAGAAEDALARADTQNE